MTDANRAVEQLMIDNWNPRECAIEQDEFWDSLGPYNDIETPPVGMLGIPGFGPFHRDDFTEDMMVPGDFTPSLVGLGAVKPVVQPEKITVTPAEPVKASTVYLIAGVAAVAIIGSIALWAWRTGD